MRVLCLFLALVLFDVCGKTITIRPNSPEGSVAFYDFTPATELEKKAYLSTKEYLVNNNKKSNFYIIKHGLDVSTGLYSFKLQDPSSFGNSNKLILNKSYNNSIAYYDAKSNSIVKFVRWKK
jgi:hypothetical protein